MIKIVLNCGRALLIDDIDYPTIKALKVYSEVQRGRVYARVSCKKNGKNTFEKLHRIIMNVTDSSTHVDHIDGNGLNNCRSNLRICSASDNLKNRPPRGKSKYMGVSAHGNRWLSRININGKQKHIGIFEKEEDAAIAYDKEAIKTGNNFYRLNILSPFNK